MGGAGTTAGAARQPDRVPTRRFEPGRHYDDDAVKSDIAAFARTGDMPMDTHDFVIDASGGVLGRDDVDDNEQRP
jgi:hypothetical protein